MNKYVFLLILSTLVTLSFPTVSAQNGTGTEVKGIIQENTTWTTENSPYTLTGNVLVNYGMSLIIQAGTVVNLGSYYIMVNGTLRAIGNQSNAITFNGGEIIFTQNSTDWNESTDTGCIIQNVVTSSKLTFNNSPKLCNDTTFNEITIQTTNGMPLITNNIIKGGMVVVGNGNVSNNIIMDYGIDVFGSNLIIYNNTISGCTTGILVSTVHYSPSRHWVDRNTLIEKNLIVNNTNGITINAWQMFTPCAPTIMNNTISNNMNGISLTYLFSYNEPTIMYNNIYANFNYNVNNQVPEDDVNATYNWWGTTDEDTIKEQIFDYYDDFNLGTVNFSPFLNEPNTEVKPIPEFRIWTMLTVFLTTSTLVLIFKKRGYCRITRLS